VQGRCSEKEELLNLNVWTRQGKLGKPDGGRMRADSEVHKKSASSHDKGSNRKTRRIQARGEKVRGRPGGRGREKVGVQK